MRGGRGGGGVCSGGAGEARRRDKEDATCGAAEDGCMRRDGRLGDGLVRLAGLRALGVSTHMWGAERVCPGT